MLNLFRRSTFLVLLSLSFFSIANPSANTKEPKTVSATVKKMPAQASPAAPTLSAANVLDVIVDETQKQLDLVRNHVSTLSSMINDNQVKALGIEKRDVLIHLQEINYLIQSIQRERFVQIDPNMAIVLLQFSFELMDHLNKSLANGVIRLGQFNAAEILQKKRARKDLTVQDIQKALTRNGKMLERLTNSVNNAGLQWYNKAYRKFDNALDWCKKWHLNRWAKWGGLSAIAGTTAWWIMDYPSFQANMPSSIHWLYGPRPHFENLSHVDNYTTLGPLGKISTVWAGGNHGNLPVFLAALGLAYKSSSDLWEEVVKPFANKKYAEWSNKLKGGAYLAEARRAGNILEDLCFNDLVGLEDVKREFQIIVDYLSNPESFDRTQCAPPKGILLIGDTRTGKSHSVKALSGEITRMLAAKGNSEKIGFFPISGAEINEFGITRLLHLIKSYAPCVLFIDEIDLLDLQRKGKNDLLMQFLTSLSGTLDKTDSKNQVIIIAATNRPESMDKALRAPGRFGKQIRFEYPPMKDRKEFIVRKLAKLSLSSDFFDVEKIARATEGKSYEALNILINTAVLHARLRGQGITQELIEEMIDESIHNIIPVEEKSISPQERAILAVHFAGCALATHKLETRRHLSTVTIKQVITDIKEEMMGWHLYSKKDDDDEKRFVYGGLFYHHDHDSINILSREEKLNQIAANIAGVVAEEMLLGSCGYSCHRDGVEKAIMTAQSITFEGIEPSRWPKHAQQTRFDEALKIVDECKQKVRELFENNQEALVTLAQILQQKNTLSGDEVNQVIYFVEHKDEIMAQLQKEQAMHQEKGVAIPTNDALAHEIAHAPQTA